MKLLLTEGQALDNASFIWGGEHVLLQILHVKYVYLSPASHSGLPWNVGPICPGTHPTQSPSFTLVPPACTGCGQLRVSSDQRPQSMVTLDKYVLGKRKHK